MTKQEQESRINALQKNLQSFAGGGHISDQGAFDLYTINGFDADSAIAPESSDDEEDSEESEEE